MNKPELLSPAGSMEALQAAIKGGADAVYLGGKSFNARQNANNFESNELVDTIKICKLYNVKLYITVNILVKDVEFDSLVEYICFLYKIGVDAIIVQDLGLFYLVKKMFPNFPVHSSTQMSIHGITGVKLLEELGFDRVVLARELTLEEIEVIVNNTRSEIKIFNHGALCICYSGQCLMSSIIGGRSGNRGRCAQPCRKHYELIDLSNNKTLEKGYLLSTKDLNTIDIIDKMIETGAHSFKIEGRMKSPEYVYLITNFYRKKIDGFFRKENHIVEKDKFHVKQIFNRGFSTGYLAGYKGKEMISTEKPKNKGTLLGEISEYKNGRVVINLNNDLRLNDGIELISGKKGFGLKITYMENINNKSINEAYKGQKVIIKINNKVFIGDKVYKTFDYKLDKDIKAILANNKGKKIKINGIVTLELNKPVKLRIWDYSGHIIEVVSEKSIEKAINKNLTNEIIKRQISKLGNSPFEFESLEIISQARIAIALSQLNFVRREAINKLYDIIVAKERDVNINVIETYNQYKLSKKQKNKVKTKLSIKIDDINLLKTIVNTEIQEVIFGGDIYFNLEKYQRAIEITKNAGKSILFAFPRITRNDYLKTMETYIEKIIEMNPDGLMLSNYEMIYLFKDYNIYKEADFSMNCYNQFALRQLQDIGIKSVCLSPELNKKQINDLLVRSSMPLSIIAHGYQELMISEYCPFSCDPNKKDCIKCNYTDNYALKDEKGMMFPLITDEFGRSHVLNCVKLCLLEELKNIKGINKVIIDSRYEKQGDLLKTIEAYDKNLYNINNGIYEMPNISKEYLNRVQNIGITKGHFNRGIK